MFIIFNTNNDDVKIYNEEEVIIFDDICSLKYLKNDEYILIIIDSEVDENGVLKNYNFIFEEILITINIKMIITNIINQKLLDITDFYKIPLIKVK